ncbi:hypothetical protein KEM54_003996, partial [Ascosphaera aggregata]
MLAPSKPKASRRLSTFFFGGKDKDKTSSSHSSSSSSSDSKNKKKSPGSSKQSNNTSITDSNNDDSANQEHISRHTSLPSKHQPLKQSPPATETNQESLKFTSTVRAVSAPLTPNDHDYDQSTHPPADITNSFADVTISSNPDSSSSPAADPWHEQSANPAINNHDTTQPSLSPSITTTNHITTAADNAAQNATTRHVLAPTITMDAPDDSLLQLSPQQHQQQQVTPFTDLPSAENDSRGAGGSGGGSNGSNVSNGSTTSLVLTPPPAIPAATMETRRYSGSSARSLAVPHSGSSSTAPISATTVTTTTTTTTSKEERSSKTRSWNPTAALKQLNDKKAHPPPGNGLRAWVAGGAALIPYDLTPLLSGEG